MRNGSDMEPRGWHVPAAVTRRVSKRGVARIAAVAHSTVALPVERAEGPLLLRLTARPSIGQSLVARANPMGQRGERAMFPEAPAVAAAGADEADAVARPIDALMDRYARGDDDALDELYRLCASRVRGFLARLCAN